MFRANAVMVLCVLGVTGVLGASSAIADEAAPGVQVSAQFVPTNLTPGGEGTLVIELYDDGAARAENETIVDKLPAGITAVPDEATIPAGGGSVLSCSGEATVTCTARIGLSLPGAEFGQHSSIQIPVRVADVAEGTLVNHITAEVEGAVSATSHSTPVTISSTPAGFGFTDAEAWFSNSDGTIDTQAGSHPYELTFVFTLNDIGGPGSELAAGGDVRRVNVSVPPGIVGDTRAVPQCTLEQFEASNGGNPGCPDDTQVGEDVVTVGDGVIDRQAVYNMVPPAGVPAQFAFRLSGIITRLNADVRTGGDNGITERTSELAQDGITYNAFTLWGVPAEASHDESRDGRECEPAAAGDKCPANIAPTPLLTLPTSCGEPLTFTAEALGTYEDESAYARTSATPLQADGEPLSGLTGCDLLGRFDPEVTIAPETTDADTPAGLTAEVRVPEEDLQSLTEPGRLASPNLKDTTVTLPEGVVINPGQATGLEACQPSQENLGGEGEQFYGPPSCPAASKVGEDEIETPLLANKLKGNVYILSPNPPNLQLLVTASGEGVNLKLVGHVHLNETTGQLTTTFDETPELPFRSFKLIFSGGARAALATPTKCGTYESTADFTPWDAPANEDALSSSLFQIDSDPNGSACQWPLPFTPTLTAGATTDQAGGYTGFTMLLQREDGQQRIGTLQFKTPPGLLGMISHVQLCQEPQAASGECPAASQIGHTVATSGPGPYPFEVPQAGGPPAPIYITGPYDGAPYGLSIKVPVVAGPFNLGTVIVRAKIEVDPHTSQLTITTTDLPKILDGIPTDIREVDADIERPDFMFNPTNCDASAFTGTATSLEGATAPLSSRFEVGSCRSLAFKPTFTATTSAQHTRKDGDSLTVKVGYPTTTEPGQATSEANIAKVKVELPKKLPSRLSTLQKACTEQQFASNPAGCPAESIVGTAVVHTPVLPQPLKGPAYFVSHGGAKFPELIVVLQGENGVTIQLNGETFISKKGITSSTFDALPDVPFSSFELTLPTGPHSALAAFGNLCKKTLEMPTTLTGQNGAVIKENTKVNVGGCKTAKKKTKKHNKHKKHNKKAHSKKNHPGKRRKDKK